MKKTIKISVVIFALIATFLMISTTTLAQSINGNFQITARENESESEEEDDDISPTQDGFWEWLFWMIMYLLFGVGPPPDA